MSTIVASGCYICIKLNYISFLRRYWVLSHVPHAGVINNWIRVVARETDVKVANKKCKEVRFSDDDKLIYHHVSTPFVFLTLHSVSRVYSIYFTTVFLILK